MSHETHTYISETLFNYFYLILFLFNVALINIFCYIDIVGCYVLEMFRFFKN